MSAAIPTPPAAPGEPISRGGPGPVVGIVGFALSFAFPLDIAGVVLCIIALRKVRRTGGSRVFAICGLVIGMAGIVFGTVCLALILPGVLQVTSECARLGDGVHVVGTATYTCTPVGGSVVYGQH